jgi:hypothetical protein
MQPRAPLARLLLPRAGALYYICGASSSVAAAWIECLGSL